MSEIIGLLEQVANGEHLTREQAGRAFQMVMGGGCTPPQIAALLMGLRINGETVEEISGAVTAMRLKMKHFALPEAVTQDAVVDTCGTGGDKKGSVNISTAVAFVVAGAGVPVVKHGNKAVSSKSGSADVLAELGVNIMAEECAMQKALEQAGVCFLMAPRYHPAMRHVAPVRQELKLRTIFNLLGPLMNPAEPARQVIGVFDAAWCRPLAEVLKTLGAAHVWVVHGSDGMDEMTPYGPTQVAELKDGEVHEFTVHPEKLGVTPPEDPLALRGGDAAANAAALRRVLNGEAGAYRDAVLLNAGAALVVAGKAETLEDGMAKAAVSIDSGAATGALHGLVSASNDGEFGDDE